MGTTKKLADGYSNIIRKKTWLVALLLSVFMWQCNKDDFTQETVGICPEVVSTDPAGGASDVLLNKHISATFNEPMDVSTINTTTFTLRQGNSILPGIVSYSGLTATFVPAVNLLPNTSYTATITKGARDPARNALVEDFVWTFSTGSAPLVVSADPANGTTGVPLGKVISVLFSKPMNLATINPQTFTIYQGMNPVAGTITYSGNTALFTPTANLAQNSVYTGTVTMGATDITGNTLLSDYVWSFNTGSAPTVIQTDPANGDINVPLAKVVTATFSKGMDPATINATTFVVKHGAIAVPGVVTYTGNVATFTPNAGFVPNTLYSASITTGAKDGMGNALLANHNWTFTTGKTPYVVSTDPLDKSVNVELDKSIKATFNTAMNPMSFNFATVTVKQGTIAIPGVVSYAENVVTFTPNAALSPGTLYTATITTGVADIAGNHMSGNYDWSFTTGAVPVVITTDPANEAVNVPLNKILTATFSKAMDPATINATTVSFKQGLTPVAGAVTYFGNIVTFTPSANLLPGTLYTGTITTGATDATGNNLANNYTWSFTTGALPYVVSTDPLNAAVNVLLDKVVSATFSKAMDPLTFNNTTFTLKKGLVAVAGTVTYFGMTASFVPNDNLSPNTLYTGTITTGVKDATSNSMAANYIWSFTTGDIPDATRPTVILTSPLSNAVNVPLATNVTATFSELMDVTSINTTSFTLKNGLVLVPASVSYSGVMATLNPISNLLPGTTYRATVTTSAKDKAGNTLISNYEWDFTTTNPDVIRPTVIANSPLTNALNVPLGSNVTATFSELMDPASINSTSFTLRNGLVLVPGSVSYSGVMATLNPSADLLPGTTYRATVTTIAKDKAGNSLLSNYEWNFTTYIPAGPLGIDLKTAGKYAVLGGSGVNSTGPTIINGDLGTSPTGTVIGFPPGVVNGVINSADATAAQAKLDLTAAYLDGQSRSTSAISLPGDLSGLTLTPGLYVNSTSVLLSSGTVWLDAQGDSNATFIFKMGSTLTSLAGTQVVLSGGAQAKNIYWIVGTSATLGTNSIFYGNILADQSITLATGAVLNGRALTQIAAVSLDASIVNKP